ncbi:MAG: asparagine synthase C-terminal domain-containing protein [Halobacteriaceae archaeon]
MRGAAEKPVRAAIRAGDPLSGCDAFAGELADGRLVRDALGRQPLFVDGTEWDWHSGRLADPDPFPPGAVGHPGDTPRTVLSLPAARPRAADTAMAALEEALTIVLQDVPSTLPVGFSGGVDSALLATATAGPCYVVSFPDGPDLEAARSAAATLGRDLRSVELDLQTLSDSIPAVVSVLGTTAPLDVAIALTLYHLARAVTADGYDRVLLGQGADELFGGYQKVADAPDDDRLAADTVRGGRDEMLATIPAQTVRDHAALDAGGVTPVTPYLRDRVVSAALDLPPELLVADGTRKVALRRFARQRLPQAVADREKQALQYGSRMSRELDRLARQAGYKRREDRHIRRYLSARAKEAGN